MKTSLQRFDWPRNDLMQRKSGDRSRPTRQTLDSAPTKQADDKQQNDRTDYRCDDRADPATAKRDVQDAGKPTADKRADDPDNDVDDQPETAALDEHASQPAGDRANDEPCNDAVFHNQDSMVEREKFTVTELSLRG